MQVRRQVTLCSCSRSRGSRERLWAFSVHDLAALFGRSVVGMKKALQRGTVDFDPEDIGTICRAWADHEADGGT